MKAKIPVTERALIQRINRKLAKAGSKLVAARGEKEIEVFGHYYVAKRGRKNECAEILALNLNLEVYGRSVGVLATDEEVRS